MDCLDGLGVTKLNLGVESDLSYLGNDIMELNSKGDVDDDDEVEDTDDDDDDDDEGTSLSTDDADWWRTSSIR